MLRMSITATFEAGKIVLPPGVTWPEGTILHIAPVGNQATIWEKLDLAANHDKYFRGRLQE